jgi:hypothetical protein
MTHRPSPRPHPVTLDQARADDLLLDALGQDEPAPEGDEIAELLAAWRADLAEPLLDEVPTPARSFTGWRVRLVAAAALVTVATAGTSLAAANAGPDSPLWPVTQIVNPGHADVVTAQATLDQARRAITEGRQADARRLLDQAPGQIAKVRDPVAAQRLRDELDALRKSLTALVPGAPASVPAVRPAPGSSGTGTGTGGGATPTPTPTTGQPSGGTGSGGGGGILPSPLPSLPLPSLPSLPPILK